MWGRSVLDENNDLPKDLVLFRLSLVINKYGNPEIVKEVSSPLVLQEEMDEWNPEYPHTPQIVDLCRRGNEAVEVWGKEMEKWV